MRLKSKRKKKIESKNEAQWNKDRRRKKKNYEGKLIKKTSITTSPLLYFLPFSQGGDPAAHSEESNSPSRHVRLLHPRGLGGDSRCCGNCRTSRGSGETETEMAAWDHICDPDFDIWLIAWGDVVSAACEEFVVICSSIRLKLKRHTYTPNYIRTAYTHTHSCSNYVAT